MSYLRKHVAVVFFVLTFLISWGAWLWVAGSHQAPSGWAALVALLGAFGPSIAGVVCTGLQDGEHGLRMLIKRLLAWRVSGVVYVAALLGPLLLALLPLWLNTVLGAPVPHWQGLGRLPELLPTALKMLVVGGLTEEIGWRGFALPILRRQKGPLVASLVLGAIWGVWHVPIYSLPGLGNPIPLEGLIQFLFSTLLLTIFFTGLAGYSADSIWIAILFHAWANAVFPSLPDLLDVSNTVQLQVLNQLTWLVLTAIIVWSGRQPGHSAVRAASSIGNE